MIRVAIVDDHQLFSEGLSAALNSVPDIHVIATFTDGREFLNAVGNVGADVVLLDLEMETSGIEVLAALEGKTRFLVVSMHSGEETRSEAIRLGAAGVMSKSAPLTDLAAAVRAVAAGTKLPTEKDRTTLSELLADYQSPQLDPGAASLTERERELLALLARGVTATEELADRLFISQKTVKNHLASIYEKLAVSDRAQAAIEAIRLGLNSE